MHNNHTNYSKFLSLILRHNPDVAGIKLDREGWTDVDTLLESTDTTRLFLETVVATNNKKRFEFNSDKTKIRARQGHSLSVDLGLSPVIPPDQLFHGTSLQSVENIQSSGVRKQNRQYVHLSPDFSTALRVGARHGKPYVFRVDAKRMNKDGYVFFFSSNGVWMVDHVPPEYLTEKPVSLL